MLEGGLKLNLNRLIRRGFARPGAFTEHYPLDVDLHWEGDCFWHPGQRKNPEVGAPLT